MIQKLLILFTILTILPTHAQTQPEEKPQVICFGDSITKRGYPALLAETLGVPVINAGVAGHSSSKGVRRLEKEVLTPKPQIVVIFFGTNDLRIDAPKIHVTQKQYRQNLETMISKCQKAGIQVILCTPPPIIEEAYYQRHDKATYDKQGGITKLLESYVVVAKEIAEKEKVPLVDLHQKLSQHPTWVHPDGVHPSKAGCQLIADLVAKSVTPLLKKP